MGGEKISLLLAASALSGSPPRGRGKGRSSPCTARRCRITPAWAGKRHSCRMRRWCSGDHPRVGGEKCVPVSWATGPTGSPPRGRGKALLLVDKLVKHRITPAWAGKRPEFTLHCSALWDHPRVGGEKLERRTFWACMVGSPPRGRGKETSPHLYCELSRITPAWAGKSGSGSCYCLGSGDHPRMGGEKWNLRQRSKMLLGSPPHGRGKAFWSFCTCAAARITPAWAGKSCHFWDCQKGVRITPAWAGKSLYPLKI